MNQPQPTEQAAPQPVENETPTAEAQEEAPVENEEATEAPVEEEGTDPAPVSDEPAPEGEGEEEAVEEQQLDDMIQDEESMKGKRFRVKLKSGQEVVIPWEEVRASYFRHKDYKAKMDQVHSTRKDYEAALEKAEHDFKHLNAIAQKSFEGFDMQINAVVDELEKYNLDDLTNDELAGYNKKKLKLEALVNQRQNAQKQVDDLTRTWDAALEEQRARTLKEENRKLVQALPELADPAKAQKFQNQIQDYLEEMLGDDVNNFEVSDHRYILMLRDAARYRAFKSKTKEPVKVNKPNRVLKSSGARPNVAEEKARKSSHIKKRANQVGGRRNTTALLGDILSNN